MALDALDALDALNAPNTCPVIKNKQPATKTTPNASMPSYSQHAIRRARLGVFNVTFIEFVSLSVRLKRPRMVILAEAVCDD